MHNASEQSGSCGGSNRVGCVEIYESKDLIGASHRLHKDKDYRTYNKHEDHTNSGGKSGYNYLKHGIRSRYNARDSNGENGRYRSYRPSDTENERSDRYENSWRYTHRGSGANNEHNYDKTEQKVEGVKNSEVQDDWSLHPSGRYYISKSSPWCYNQEFGYFYFGKNEEIVYEKNKSYDTVPLKKQPSEQDNVEKKDYGNNIDSKEGKDSNEGEDSNESSSNNIVANMTRKEYDIGAKSHVFKLRTPKDISSEVVAQAMALSSLPTSDISNGPYTKKDFSEPPKYGRNRYQNHNYTYKKKRPGTAYSEQRENTKSKKNYNDNTSVYFKNDFYSKHNSYDNSRNVPSKTKNYRENTRDTESRSPNAASDDSNIFELNNTRNSESTQRSAHVKSVHKNKNSRRHRSFSSSTTTIIPKKEDECYYADSGAYYGYYYYDEKGNKYVYVPPNSRGTCKNVGEMKLFDNNDESIYLPVNCYGKSTMTLVVLSSSKLSLGSTVIVDSCCLSVGRSRSDGKNRLAIRELELSRTHCSIHLSLLLVGEIKSQDDNELEKKQNEINHLTARDSQYPSSPEKKCFDNNEDARENLLSDDVQNFNRKYTPSPIKLPDRNFAEVFFLIDRGSTQGTFLNDERLSKSKTVSHPNLLKHKDVIRVGKTVLEVHIHPEWPCDKCRITGSNLIPTTIDMSIDPQKPPTFNTDRKDLWATQSDGYGNTIVENTRICLEMARLKELKRLKRRLLNGKDRENQKKSKTRSTYIDRAAMRRSLYMEKDYDKQKNFEDGERMILYDGNGRIDNETSVMEDIASSSLNNSMRYDTMDTLVGGTAGKILKKMGWTEGQGLGINGNAPSGPIPISMTVGRPCLGSSQFGDLNLNKNQFDERNETITEITKRRARERFFNISNN